MENKELTTLVSQASKGNKKAFEQLVEQKSQSIIFNAYNILGKYHDAEDIAQEVVLKMYKNIHKLKNPRAFNAWLQKIIVNECYTMKRKFSEQKEHIVKEDHFENIIDEDKEFLPSLFAENREQRDTIREIIRNLPVRRREIVVMYYYENLSYKDIAHVLNLPEGTVATNISRAKSHIKSKLETKTGMNVSTIRAVGAVPVLSQVLNEQANEEVSKRATDNLIDFSAHRLSASKFPAPAKGLKSPKVLAAIIAGTILVLSVAFYSITNDDSGLGISGLLANDMKNESSDQIINPDPETRIDFSGSQCDCGHLNPQLVYLNNVTPGYKKIDWEIKDESNETLTTGIGTDTTIPTNLYGKYQNREYTVNYTIDYGQKKMYINRSFIINTGHIIPGQYQ